jgi:hypothetical protein
MLIKDLNEFKNLVKEYHLLQEYGLQKIAVFGAFARGEKTDDIDILVDTIKNYKDLIGLKEKLETLTDKKIDIVIEKYANPIVLYRAKKELVDVS